ncbi:hypothetical protein SCACP_03020 [Sporomusa carbonis]
MAATSRGMRHLSGTHGQVARFVFAVNLVAVNIGNKDSLRYNNIVKAL